MQTSRAIDKKGIFSFLAITFVTTYTLEGILIALGVRFDGIPPIFSQLVVMGVMWVPALATVLTIRFITREGFGITNFRFGPFKPYLFVFLIVPVLFILIYEITWLLGLGAPDWDLSNFIFSMEQAGAPVDEIPPAQTFLPVIFLTSLFVSPFINSIFAFGEEYGWRGYLLPKLMPLGKIKAYLLVGIIWGLWHAPLIVIGFNYPGHPILGIIWMMGLTTALGLFLNEMTLRYQSSILAGWIHGVINSQGYGIWRLLFAGTHPLLGGITGLVGIAIWILFGLWSIRRAVPVRDPIT